MKHFTAILFFVAILAIPATSQTPAKQSGDSKCTAKFAQSIAIRGIHLGMNADELLTIFPDVQEIQSLKQRLETAKGYPRFGSIEISLNPSGNIANERLAGINSLSMTIFDNQVVSYSISYVGPPKGAQWYNLNDWLTKLSETLNLPSALDWVSVDQEATLICEGVRITASANGLGNISVRREDWKPQIVEREKAYHDRKRREFKP